MVRLASTLIFVLFLTTVSSAQSVLIYDGSEQHALTDAVIGLGITPTVAQSPTHLRDLILSSPFWDMILLDSPGAIDSSLAEALIDPIYSDTHVIVASPVLSDAPEDLRQALGIAELYPFPGFGPGFPGGVICWLSFPGWGSPQPVDPVVPIFDPTNPWPILPTPTAFGEMCDVAPGANGIAGIEEAPLGTTMVLNENATSVAVTMSLDACLHANIQNIMQNFMSTFLGASPLCTVPQEFFADVDCAGDAVTFYWAGAMSPAMQIDLSIDGVVVDSLPGDASFTTVAMPPEPGLHVATLTIICGDAPGELAENSLLFECPSDGYDALVLDDSSVQQLATAVDRLGLGATHTTNLGDFMAHLTDGTTWDFVAMDTREVIDEAISADLLPVLENESVRSFVATPRLSETAFTFREYVGVGPIDVLPGNPGSTICWLSFPGWGYPNPVQPVVPIDPGWPWLPPIIYGGEIFDVAPSATGLSGIDEAPAGATAVLNPNGHTITFSLNSDTCLAPTFTRLIENWVSHFTGAVPTTLCVANLTCERDCDAGSVTLTWDGLLAESYTIERNGEELAILDGAATSYTDTFAPTERTAYAVVRHTSSGDSGTACAAPPCDLAATFIRGDANGDQGLDVGDAIFSLSALFGGGPAWGCRDAADFNDDGAVNIGDAVATLSYVFTSGMAPPSPFPTCGTDPTIDSIDCQTPTCAP